MQIISKNTDNDFLLTNGNAELSFRLIENTISIFDFNVLESSEDATNLIKSLEHFAIKHKVAKIDVAAIPSKASLKFWESYNYQYSNYVEDKEIIHTILENQNTTKVFDTISGVVVLTKDIDKLQQETYLNKVQNKDVLEVLKHIPDNCLDMVYGDPDYNVGINYAGKNYTTKWNEYIDWYITLTKECMRVLKPTGSLFMMNYPKQNAYLRVKFLDDNAYNVQDYVWIYNTNVGHTPRRFTTAHRSILHATKSKENAFYKDQVAVPYQNPSDKRIQGRIAAGHLGRMPYSWFYFDLVKNVSKDKTFHACQIPLNLVEMLIKSCTKENDDVFILFGGSGSELLLCQQLKRNFISCEIHPEYYSMILDRLNNNGHIKDEFKLAFVQERKQQANTTPNLFL